MDNRTGRRQKRLSKQQEEKTAAELGGRTQANSGATRMGGGGDVRIQGKYRIECKFTEGPRYTLKLSDLEKLKKQANAVAEVPIFQFQFRSKGRSWGQAYAVQFGSNDIPAWLPFKSFETYAKQVVLSELDLARVFAEEVRIEGYDKVLKNHCIVINFLKSSEKESWVKSFRIMPWEAFLKDEGEKDA